MNTFKKLFAATAIVTVAGVAFAQMSHDGMKMMDMESMQGMMKKMMPAEDDTESTKARAIVQDAGKTTTVALETQAPNRLVGALSGPLGPGARVVVSATLADGHAIQARFVNN